MTARMHLALDRSFGRRSEDVTERVDSVERIVVAADPALFGRTRGGRGLRGVAGGQPARPGLCHTHGDFHLGRTARTDQGWVVADCMPGGVPPGATDVVFRSPLADVADMLWSLHHVASVAASERDPTGRSGLAAVGPGLGGPEPAGLFERVPGDAGGSAAWCRPDPRGTVGEIWPPCSSSNGPPPGSCSSVRVRCPPR